MLFEKPGSANPCTRRAEDLFVLVCHSLGGIIAKKVGDLIATSNNVNHLRLCDMHLS